MFTLPRLIYRYSKINSQISFTDKCKQILNKKKLSNFAKFLRLSIQAGEGCEGFKYKFLFDSSIHNNDLVYETNAGVEFAIQKQCLDLVSGCMIDYEDKLMRQGFFVKENPNAEASCSCKTSFSPKQIPIQK